MRYLIVALLLLTAIANAQNPKAMEEMTAVINLGGTLAVSGSIEKANLSLHIPQEGVENIVVSGVNSWDYINDKFGNKLLLLEWENPTGLVNYDVKVTVKNRAKHFSSLGDIGNDPQYLKETATIVITDDIRKMAFPYERSWQRIAELTIAVNKLVDYDINLVGERKDSDWVLRNKRGVCVEHANLLAALLRASGVPTRYVVGYAFSSVDNKLIGHTWVEVLNSKGEWIPFDPTWLEGGYLDATHIKTANLLDDSQADTLNYFGRGKIEWQRTEENLEIATRNLTRDRIDIINYKLANITTIDTFPREFPSGGYGFVKARIESECSISDLTASSCIDDSGQKMFDIYDSNRIMWLCTAKDVYWFFDIRTTRHSSYVCPVSVYDQVGSSESAQISIQGRAAQKAIALSGPDKVGINEPFALTGEGLLYSPDFGVITGSLSIDTTGRYKFYLYSDGALAQKEVEVVESKQFSIRVDAPTNTTLNSSFLVSVHVKNLAAGAKPAVIKVHFDERTSQQSHNFLPNEEKEFVFNLTAKTSGIKKITAEVISDSLESYTTFIDIEEPPQERGPLDAIISSVSSIIDAIIDFFKGIFNLK
jgi:hypothetical protein